MPYIHPNCKFIRKEQAGNKHTFIVFAVQIAQHIYKSVSSVYRFKY